MSSYSFLDHLAFPLSWSLYKKVCKYNVYRTISGKVQVFCFLMSAPFGFWNSYIFITLNGPVSLIFINNYGLAQLL